MADKRNSIDNRRFPKQETLQVTSPSTFLRRSARPSAPAETELLCGTLFHVHKTGRGWVWGQAECQLPGKAYPGYVGWCRSKDLAELDKPHTHKVTALAAPVFTGSDIKSPVQYHLSMGSSFASVYSLQKFEQIKGGYVHAAHIAEIRDADQNADWVQIAERFLGRPYVWGGVSSFGLDCSGLVQTALRLSGSDAPRDSDQQAELGKPVKFGHDLSGLKRGDLVFWKGHVGVMTSSAQLLHANAWHMAVASEPLEAAVKRIKKMAGSITAIRRL